MIGQGFPVRVRAQFAGAYTALFAFAVLVVPVLLVLGLSVEASSPAPPLPLAAWSNERVLGELGEAAQVAPCDDLIGGEGFTARFFVDEEAPRLLIVCTPTR